MHDGFKVQFSCALRNVLSYTYRDGWIGRGGPTAWPSYSPDFNPLNLKMWGHIKTFVPGARVNNEEALQHQHYS
jgi:hypothetical protein